MSKISKEPKNCWEFWSCPKEIREKCLTYIKNLGRECWTVKECFTTAEHPKAEEKRIEYCWECRWFKKLNPNFKSPNK